MIRPVVITAPSANCGKTALACHIAAQTPGIQALKITRFHREEHCPVHGVSTAGDDNCDGCAPAPAGFELIEDDTVLRTPGKDTDRLIRAGASPVLWLRAAPTSFEYALAKAMKRLDAMQPLLIEGNSAATIPSFDATVVLIWPQRPRGVKASVMPALKRCDNLVLVEAESGPARQMPQTLRQACSRAGVTVNDLPQPHWLPAGWWLESANAQNDHKLSPFHGIFAPN
jgi:hypothetical protein